MQGLGTIVVQNSDNADLLRRVAEARYPEYVNRTRNPRPGLFPTPVFWGEHLLAIVWHQEKNGQVVHIEILHQKGFKKLFCSLKREQRAPIFRACGESDEE